MGMYKLPARREKVHPVLNGKPKEGTFLFNILKKSELNFESLKKQPVYNQDEYLKLLEKNNKELGIPYVSPIFPEFNPNEQKIKIIEPELLYCDRIQVNLRVLKNGTVRVKINCSMANLYEKYYRNAKVPPIKEVIQVYKSYGFSNEFLEKIKKNHEKAMKFTEKVPKILERIFDKEPVKKPKKEKVKKMEEDDELDNIPEEEQEDDDDDNIPDDEGELDIEPQIDEEEVVEDDYFSEPDT